MGPVALFDKSFLQSLTLDESVWFDHFFLAVICPVFYVETLADLAKTKRSNSSRTPQDEVRILADKSPVLSGAPCVHHMDMCIANLLGHQAPKLGQVPLAGGRPIRTKDNKAGVVFKPSPEAESFARWQRHEFMEVERDTASAWRAMLSSLNLPEVAQRMRALGVTPKNCKSVKEAWGLAHGLMHSQAAPLEQIGLLFEFVHVPVHLQGEILHRWSSAGFPPLANYAPYAAHVLKVEMFFQIALAANLISADRASNRADIAYLFYLPFCNLFVSGDKLHKLCTPPFLAPAQDFIWGPDLKASLSSINSELSSIPQEEREQGLHKIAPRPRGNASNVVVSMWEKHSPKRGKLLLEEPIDPTAERKLVEELKKYSEAPTAPDVAQLPSEKLDNLALERLVPARKGSWWLLPKAMVEQEQQGK